MPFKSAKQRRFLFAVHSKIAKKWAKEGKSGKSKKSGGKKKGKKK